MNMNYLELVGAGTLTAIGVGVMGFVVYFVVSLYLMWGMDNVHTQRCSCCKKEYYTPKTFVCKECVEQERAPAAKEVLF
jgi:hypothetical protein